MEHNIILGVDSLRVDIVGVDNLGVDNLGVDIIFGKNPWLRRLEST